jgi:hypothetical protein
LSTPQRTDPGGEVLRRAWRSAGMAKYMDWSLLRPLELLGDIRKEGEHSVAQTTSKEYA